MRAWSEALDISPDDPRKVLVEAALVLADLVDRRQAMPAAARELSSCVESILDFGERGSVVDELRARRAGRRVAMLVENANRGGTVA